MSNLVSRERAHELIEMFWAPECITEKNIRHDLIDRMFDAQMVKYLAWWEQFDRDTKGTVAQFD